MLLDDIRKLYFLDYTLREIKDQIYQVHEK